MIMMIIMMVIKVMITVMKILKYRRTINIISTLLETNLKYLEIFSTSIRETLPFLNKILMESDIFSIISGKKAGILSILYRSMMPYINCIMTVSLSRAPLRKIDRRWGSKNPIQ